ncbi:hypothetical protein LTR22_019969 [Elasticomyces elasticus]|nr:hypothetical protein LTR22_019969 [Elasticomyces elasticus]
MNHKDPRTKSVDLAYGGYVAKELAQRTLAAAAAARQHINPMEYAQIYPRDAKVAPADHGSLQRRGTRELIGGALRRSTCEICKDHRW